jgi:hypothetical protein
LLVDVDQTGFIKGRSIFENFVYATKLIQQAEGTNAGDQIGHHQGVRLCELAESPPDTAGARLLPSSVLMDEAAIVYVLIHCAGKWHSRPLDHVQTRSPAGDALSPYLFLLVADVLERLIKGDDGIRHLLSDCPSLVLQYADDTIPVVKATRGLPNA